MDIEEEDDTSKIPVMKVSDIKKLSESYIQVKSLQYFTEIRRYKYVLQTDCDNMYLCRKKLSARLQ